MKFNEKGKAYVAERYKVYNLRNQLITEKDILAMLKIGGIVVKQTLQHMDHWQEAFVHTSYYKYNSFKYYNPQEEERQLGPIEMKKYIPLQETSCERLEWLGDSILQMSSAIMLFERFDDADEGFLTKNRCKLVRTKMLAELAHKLGMAKFILMSQHVEDYVDGRNNDKILEDTFEAFIGALYQEFKSYGRKYALDICYTFLETIYNRFVNFQELVTMDDNYKDQLMRYCHKNMDGFNPIYKESVDSNPTVDTSVQHTYSGPRTFHIHVYDKEGKQIADGFGRNKQEAEQDGAKRALQYYGILSSSSS